MNLHSSMVDTRWPIRGAGSKTSTSSMAFAFGFCIWFLLLCYDFLHSAAVTNTGIRMRTVSACVFQAKLYCVFCDGERCIENTSGEDPDLELACALL